MYSIYTPISYNTNLNSVLAHYYFGYCGGYCNPYASLFNGYSIGNYANNFRPQYPTLCPDSQNMAQTPSPAYSSLMMNYNPFNTGGRVIRDVSFPTVWAQPTGYNNQTSVPVQTQQPAAQTTSDTKTSNPFSAESKPAAKPAIKTSTNTAKAPAAVNKKTSVSTSQPVKLQKTQAQSFTSSIPKTNADLRKDFITTALKYSNCNEADGSQHKFCINNTCKYEDPYDQEWCTDFVTYVVKEAYRKNGKTVPAGFGNHDVRTLKNWAINNNYFIRTSNKSQKGNYIANNIRPGDIIILNENGASHTGFVTHVGRNGTIHTIEGNRDDKVSRYVYSPNYPDISGFIRLTA